MQSVAPFDQKTPVIHWLRSNRLLHVSEVNGSLPKAHLTVFIGLYNASDYWQDIVNYLESQTFKHCDLLIADNASSDDTWDLIMKWAPEGFHTVTKSRNPANVGGAGNLYANLDLVQTPWVTTCHQDDLYYPNHLELHQKLTSSAKSRIAMVASSMDRLSHESYKPVPIPRVNWIANLETPADVFLTHLRFHALPFPAASFRTQALSEVETPWHDTSFPDTEMVMKLASNWDFVSSHVCTMAYRENPISESHVITSTQREEGQARALLRVFSSVEVRNIAKSVRPEDRDGFFHHAIESINLRLSSERLRHDVKLSLAESLAMTWGYGSQAVNHFIQDHMSRSGNKFGTGFFDFQLVDLSLPRIEEEGAEVDRSKYEPMPGDVLALNLKRSIIKLAFKVLHRLGILAGRKDLDYKWRKKL